jgi:hypothetical protein
MVAAIVLFLVVVISGSNSSPTMSCCCGTGHCPITKKLDQDKTGKDGHDCSCCKAGIGSMSKKDGAEKSAATSNGKCESCKIGMHSMKGKKGKVSHPTMSGKEHKNEAKLHGMSCDCPCCSQKDTNKRTETVTVASMSY